MKVHPHACGELLSHSFSSYSSNGSSPRVWGTLLLLRRRLDLCRFIPTRVGNSLSSTEVNDINSVHPHACGELISKNLPAPDITGSSPRVWGTHQTKDAKRKMMRFIPTRVGNSPIADRFSFGGGVHPHACGELTPAVWITNGQSGSSPRVWGTPIQTV